MAVPPMPQAPPPPVAPPPPAPYPYYPPSQPSGSSKTVLIVVVVVLAILLPAGILYVMTTGLLRGGTVTTPKITVGAPESCGNQCWEAVVAGVSGEHPLGMWEVSLLLDEEFLGSGTLSEGTFLASPAATVAFDDNGDGGLSGGDKFRVESSVSFTTSQLTIVFTPSGDVVTTINWNG